MCRPHGWDLTSSAVELASRVRRGEVPATALVREAIERAHERNPKINAIVAERYASALEEARSIDALSASERGRDPRPLLGVPCLIKESFSLEGMPNTSGLVARRGIVASGDATAVARLRAAGAIPIGVTNTSELCMWHESRNRVYGRTNNAYDASRIAGGSSGGSGAGVGAGIVPFALGSDIGGSIRMPAFFNGVFGHKPSGGLVPGSGQHPIAHGKALRYLTTGPITTRAADLMPLLRVLAGPDGVDQGCSPIPLGEPSDVDVATLRVINVPDNGLLGVSPELRRAQERVVRHLHSLGARVQTVRLPALRATFPMWAAALTDAGGPDFSTLLGEGARLRLRRELPRYLLRRSPHTLPALILAVAERVPTAVAGDLDRALAQIAKLKAELADRIGDHGVMIYPSFPRTAPRHHAPLLSPLDWTYTALFNVLEMPATQVPLGLGSSGLPTGVQIASTHGGDHRTIATALELERAFGGWIEPRLA